MNAIIQNLTDTIQFWNSHDDFFIESDRVKIHRYAGSIEIVDIQKAMQPGEVCERYSLNFWPHDVVPSGVDQLFAGCGMSARKVVEVLALLPWQKRPHWKTGQPTDDWKELECVTLAGCLDPAFANNTGKCTVTLHRSENQAIRVWSPFAKVKPLPQAPKKWTIPHVIRALMAGQFTYLKCNGVYTDDYAFDAAVNFQAGKIKNAVAFARRIMESPSGWWTSERDGIVSICCHHFDSNEFKFSLKPCA